MPISRPALLFVPILLFSPVLAAQSPPRRDAQALAILTRAYAAMRGPAVQTISDLTISGRITAQRAQDSAQGTLVFKLIARNVHRVDVQIPGLVFSQIVNGRRASRTENGKTKRLPYHAILDSCPDLFPVLSEIADLNNPVFQLVYLGTETLNGRAVEHIRVEKFFTDETPANGKLLSAIDGADLFIDQTNFLLLKRSRRVPSIENLKSTVLVEQVFSNYQLFGGVLVPQTVTTYVRGQKISDIAVTSVALNTGLSPTEFEVQP